MSKASPCTSSATSAGSGHTTDQSAVMYFSYVDCRRELTAHDIESMDANYPGH